jgi:hypothetical protein
MWTFTPDDPSAATVIVPYLEDARADYAPFYRSGKSIEAAKSEITDALELLGAGILGFHAGTFTIDDKERLGFIIRFSLNVRPFDGAEGVIRIAGLPIRRASTDKQRQVKVQALLVAASWLKAAVTARVFSPDAHPLVPHLLIPGKDGVARTVTDVIAQVVKRPDMPLLGGGS